MGKETASLDRIPVPPRPDTRVTQSAGEADSGPQPPAGPSLEVSAIVTGFDGAVIGRVTRHREPARPIPQPGTI